MKWDDLNARLDAITPEERDEIELKMRIIKKMIDARKDGDITQNSLGEMTGIDQAVIARLENNRTDPRLTTLLKLLRPLGLTLDVVPIDKPSGKVG